MVLINISKFSIHLSMAKKKSNSGRKPVEPSEKIILVGFYIKRKYVDALGGMENVRDIAKKEIEGHAHNRGHW